MRLRGTVREVVQGIDGVELMFKTENFNEALKISVPKGFGGDDYSVDWWADNWPGRLVDVDIDVHKMECKGDKWLYLVLTRIWAVKQTDEFVLELIHMARAGEISVDEYRMMRGQYEGYKTCCIKNYINLSNLGYSPALFMSVVNGSTADAGHVLCPNCEDAWEGPRAFPSFRPEANAEKAQYKELLNQLR